MTPVDINKKKKLSTQLFNLFYHLSLFDLAVVIRISLFLLKPSNSVTSCEDLKSEL